MPKRSLVFILFVVLTSGLLIGAKQRSSLLDGSPPATQWEVGVYRVLTGEFPYEWQDRNRHVLARTQKIFLEKLELSWINWDLEKMHNETSPPFPREVVDTAFLNELGRHGWQLFDIQGEGARRSYWLRRSQSVKEL